MGEQDTYNKLKDPFYDLNKGVKEKYPELELVFSIDGVIVYNGDDILFGTHHSITLNDLFRIIKRYKSN